MRSRRGFTLLEVVVAVSILGMAATALFGLFSKSVFNLGRIEELHRYQLAAEDVMNRVSSLSRLPARGEAQGTLEDIDGRWEVTVAPYAPLQLDGQPPEAIVKIDVQLSFPGRTAERQIRLETIKPVTVVYGAFDLADAIETAYPR